MIQADIYRHYNSRDYGLRWESSDGFRVDPDGPTPQVVAERAIMSMLRVTGAKSLEATFRVLEWDAKGERADSGVRIRAAATAPTIEVVTLPADDGGDRPVGEADA